MKYLKSITAVRPSAPEAFEASNIDNVSALLTWALPDDRNAYKSFIVVPGVSASEQEVAGTQFRMERLLPDTQFLIRLQIENQLGQRSRPVYTSFNTLVDPLIEPLELRVLLDDTDAVTLGWKASSGGVDPKIYEVSVDGVIYSTTDKLTETVKNLTPGTEYIFTVACSDQIGTFSQSVSITHSTPSSLKIRGVVASPRHDPYEFKVEDAAPRTGFSSAELEFVVEGGTPPYKIDLLGSTAATVNGLVVTLLRKGGIPLKIKDSRGAEVNYLINPLHWFSTPSNTTFNHNTAAAGGQLPDVHTMSNRGGPGDRQVGSLCSEWGDLTKYGWPKLKDHVYYWTKSPSSNPPLGRNYEAVGVEGNIWGGRLDTNRYYVSYVS